MSINLIACVTFYRNKLIIGKDNDLLLPLKEDLQYFKRITSNRINQTANVVLMGRKTWFSIPIKNRPLKNRINFVLTNDNSLIKYKESQFKTVNDIQETVYFLNLKMFLSLYKKFKLNVFVIGGSDIYNLFLDQNIDLTLRPSKLYITEMKDYFKYNAYDKDANYISIKTIPEYYRLVSVSNKMYANGGSSGISFRFLQYNYTDKTHEEKIYTNMLRDILNNGNKRIDRTNVGTVSVFGTQMRFDISQGLPLLTTRFIPLRIIIEELLWFLRGDTDAKILQDKNVHIWDGNTSREFLDNRGLQHYKEGILGPGYGFQMRFFGAKYSQMFADTSKFDTSKVGGFDQLKYILNLLNEDPFSRRMMMSYWNPPDFDKTALIPCFVKDTLVLTKNGYKMIQDIEDNDLLYTHNRNWKPIITKHKKMYYGDIYNFKLANNHKNISCTEEHPFFIKSIGIKSQPFWCAAKNVDKEKHYMCLPINKRCLLNKDCSLLKNNKDIWFVLGYFVNTGSINTYLNSIYLHIYRIGNEDHETTLKSKLLNILRDNFGFNSGVSDSVTIRGSPLTPHDENGMTGRVRGESLHDENGMAPLQDLDGVTEGIDGGLGGVSGGVSCDNDYYNGCNIDYKNSYIISECIKPFFNDCVRNIPEWVQDAPCEYIYEFLLGFFYSYYHNNIDVVGNNIIYSIQRLYAKISNDKYIVSEPHFSSLNNLNNMVMFDTEYIYYPIEEITITEPTTESFIDSDFINCNKSILKGVEVYNFEVADDNSYTVNNIIAHNCHTNVQFYVEKDESDQLHLSCQFYMRSNDFALANNFNVVSYTILTYILALKCNMKPKEIIFTCGDTHVYKNHIQPIQEQLNRNPRPFPVLLLNEDIKHKDFNSITVDDFDLCGYFPHPTIKLDMAI